MVDIETVYEKELRAIQIMFNRIHALTTQRAYLYDIKRFLSHFAGKPISEITKLEIHTYLDEIGGSFNATLGTVQHNLMMNRALAAIKEFYRCLNELEFVQTNPVASIRKGKSSKNKKPVFLDEHKLKSALNLDFGKYHTRNMAIYCLMAFCGLRVGEVHRLNIDNYNPHLKQVIVLGKGSKFNAIPLPDHVNALIKEAISQRNRAYKSTEQALFVSQKGRRMSIRMIQKMTDQLFSEMKKQHILSEDEHYTPHKLRHSFATLLMMNDVDIRVVKELMGHSSIEVTMQYSHVVQDQKAKAMQTINFLSL